MAYFVKGIIPEKSPTDEEGGMSRYSSGIGADSRAIVRGFPLKAVLANQKAELLANVEVCLSRPAWKNAR